MARRRSAVRADLVADLLATRRRLGGPAGADGDRTGDEADRIVQAEADELDATARARLAEHARRLEAAIARVDAGTYGRCEACEAPIAPARLRALPDATTCVTCQAAQEAEGERRDGRAWDDD